MYKTLYKDITTEEIKTFSEIKEEYAENNNSDLPVDNDTMELIIFENLTQNGGNIQEINHRNDNIFAWVNCYAEEMNVNKYLTHEELEISIKNVYEGLLLRDKHTLDSIKENLSDGNFESVFLWKQLEKIMEDL